MGAAERRKGAAAERELANLLQDALGTVVQRRLGQERDGGHDIQLGNEVAVQVKRQERSSPHTWLDQAQDDAPEGMLPAVAWRPSRRGWVVMMDLEHWVKLAREYVVVGVRRPKSG